jgi:NADH-quinone oxidoreductase subunit C
MTDAEAASHAVVERLREWNAAAVAEAAEYRGEWTVVVPREHLGAAAEFLCQTAGLAFTFLSDLSGVDRYPMEPRFEVNYHLVSILRRERLRLKVKVAGMNPAVPSVVAVWPTANWHEREVWDLFGIRFEGHPDLRRILMPEDWEGHPLRKDYPVTGYR